MRLSGSIWLSSFSYVRRGAAEAGLPALEPAALRIARINEQLAELQEWLLAKGSGYPLPWKLPDVSFRLACPMSFGWVCLRFVSTFPALALRGAVGSDHAAHGFPAGARLLWNLGRFGAGSKLSLQSVGRSLRARAAWHSV